MISRLGIFFSLLAVAILIGCGGGGGGGGTVPGGGTSANPTPVFSPTVVPLSTLAPFTQDIQQAVPVPSSTDPNATPVPLPFPTSNGVAGEVDLPAAGASIPGGTIVDQGLTDQAPGDAPSFPTMVQRQTAAHRGVEGVGPKNVLLYFWLTFSKTVTLQSFPSFSITLPPGFIPSGTAFYLAFYDPTNPSAGWQDPFEGPAAVVSGNKLIFTGLSQPITFKAGVKYEFALYVVSAQATPSPRPSLTPTPTPSPTPSVTPSPSASPSSTASASPTPSGSPTASPSPTPSPTPGLLQVQPGVLAFTQPGQTATITASRTNFHGTFSAVSSNTSVVTVSPSGPTSSGVFTATAGNASGVTTITVTDSLGFSDQVSVSLTITTGTISSKTRK